MKKSIKKTLLTTCREYKSTRREGNGMNLRSEKLKRIKIQVMPLAPVAWRLTRGPRIAETWVRLPASVIFFIYSVASFLLCCRCEALEGPIS